MTYTNIPLDTFQSIQNNAGMIVDTFDPTTREFGDQLFATDGGIKFTVTPTFIDNGDGIDNCPKNMAGMKQLLYFEAKLSGTRVTHTATAIKRDLAAADVASTGDVETITPRTKLNLEDFEDLWWIGDYSDADGGFYAIHIMNALSTAGMTLTTKNEGKSGSSFEYVAHYTTEDQDKVPFEVILCKTGTANAMAMNADYYDED